MRGGSSARGPGWTRREFLHSASAALALAATGCRTLPRPRPSFRADPFALGVASGDPLPDGIVLWTRLAPAPLEPRGGMPPEPVPVGWRIAEDEGLRRVVRRGTAQALPQLAHSVHVEVSGLAPGRTYWYRFECGAAESPIGRTRTAPAPRSPLERLRFGYVSCQNFEQGYFNAYRGLLDDDVDLLVHLGDYIYENGPRSDTVRRHEGPEPKTLDAYRARHAHYRSDADLRAAHAAYPWLVTWDDHDVENDYAGDIAQSGGDPVAFHARRAAAYQAYYEHLPLRRDALQSDGAARLYRRLAFGDLVEFSVLDDRQYRSDQPCAEPGKGGGFEVENCEQRFAPSQTLLGPRQEAWLLDGLGRSKARWNAIAQQTRMAEFDCKLGPGESYWNEGWDGYAGERARILGWIGERAVPNVVVIGGDVHSFWATELRADFRNARSPVVGTEFVGTSITSQGLPYERFAALLPENPHVKFFESRCRGYVRCEVTRDRWQTEFRAVDSVLVPDSAVRTLASFSVDSGWPGISS